MCAWGFRLCVCAAALAPELRRGVSSHPVCVCLSVCVRVCVSCSIGNQEFPPVFGVELNPVCALQHWRLRIQNNPECRVKPCVCVYVCCSIGDRESHTRPVTGQASRAQRALDQQKHVEACHCAGLLPALLAVPNHLCCSCQYPLLQVSRIPVSVLFLSCQHARPQVSR